MKIEYIEAILICLVIFFQLTSFIRTWRQIQIFRYVLPVKASLKISKFNIKGSKLEEMEPAAILEQLNTIKIDDLESAAVEFDEMPNSSTDVQVGIIEHTQEENSVFRNIRTSLNTYLIRNHGAATDFHLIKDIVERNVGAIEEDINLTISIPLYLGLMGTMIGIVIGLFNIPDLSLVLDNSAKDAQLNTGIGLLIGGVKIAMIASFFGLLLTIINSGWVFKGSRIYVEANKNDFYTFIQTELLPVLNQSLGSTLTSLQRNLQLFNGEFTGNLDRLSGIFNNNYEAITAQERVLAKLETMDISQIAKFNVTVLKELQTSVSEFEKFNTYLKNINLFVESSRELADKADHLLQRTGNFESIADNLQNRLDQSQQLFEFLSVHFRQLEDHKNNVNIAVADVGHGIAGAMGDLQTHIKASTDLVRQFTVDEIEALKNALTESRTNLSNLAFLEKLNSDVSQFKTNSVTQSERLSFLLTELGKTMERSIIVLEGIQQGSLSYKVKKLFNRS